MLTHRRTRVLLLAALAAIITCVVIALALRGRQGAGLGGETAREGAAVEVEEPVISHADRGKLAWQLQLRQVQVSSGGQTVSAYGVREGLIYDRQGKPVVRVTADRVAGDTTSRDFQVTGNVRVVNSDGAVFSADTVNWVQKERRLNCPSMVTMRDKRATVSTVGLDYMVDQSLVLCPALIRMTNGDNVLFGRNLRYNVKDSGFQMENVQAVFNPKELKSQAQGASRP